MIPSPELPNPPLLKRTASKVLIATTAMLSFISFWRAAAIVLNDIGSSAFYAGAIAEHFVGKAAPWFMVVIMIVWCGYTFAVAGAHLPPLPRLENLAYSEDALGWLGDTSLPYTVGLIGILIGLGHSVLAMSGEETMAQVYREIEHPKLKNLEKAGFLIFVYSLIFTAGVAFFAVMIIPDSVRTSFQGNPIGGLAMYLVGPLWLRLAFRAFVAIVGTLMLAGAVNTSIVGSNGVLNRVSEDGILPAWFRQPHRRFGTTYRILDVVVALQLITIVLSGG